MAILKIIKYPDKILASHAKKIQKISPRLIKLSESMIETMYFFSGVGLAANQVGVLEQLIVFDIKPGGKMMPVVIFNPELLYSAGSNVLEEGCLSFPGIAANIKRAGKILISGITPDEKDIRIELSGLAARVAQHEMDHLKGVTLMDRVNILKRWALRKEYFNKNKIPARLRRLSTK